MSPQHPLRHTRRRRGSVRTAAGAWTSPPVYVHSPGANGTAYRQALTPQRVLSMRRAAPAVLITDDSPSQNRVSARNTHRAFRTVFDATK